MVLDTTLNIIIGAINLCALVYNAISFVIRQIVSNKKAELVLHVFWRDYGSCYLAIENKGRSTAKEIKLFEPRELSGVFDNLNDNIPNEIRPGDCCLLRFPEHSSIPNESCVNIYWKDKNCNNNHRLIFVHFNLEEKQLKKPEWEK